MKTQGKFILFDTVEEFSTWLDSQKVTRRITNLQVHHTWIPSYQHFKGNNHFAMAESMRNSHLGRGFSDIAQQLTTYPDGKIVYSLGRPFDEPPAGINGANANGICIEHIGNFDVGGDKISAAQEDCVLKLYAVLSKKFNLPIRTEHIVYHHWYSSDGNKVYDFSSGNKLYGTPAKSCPGTAWFGGNTVLDAQKGFIPKVQKVYDELFKTKEVKGMEPEGDDEELKLSENEWAMLKNVVDKQVKEGVFGASWATKVEKRELTVSQLAWLSMVAVSRK